MKIKIAYGVDMRLWRYNLTEDKPPKSSYKDLLTYVIKTFEFDDMKQFKITFKDDDETQTTMSSQDDFEDAFTFASKSGKKSLKLYITDSAEPHYVPRDEKEEKEINNKNNPPTTDEINAFLSDDFTVDLLSDLFVSVFEALQASNFEISFIECTQGVILSNDKYIKLTANKVWPYFMNEFLPSWSVKVEQFMIPMIKMNGINTNMIKQWLPTLFYMMKNHTQNTNNGNTFCGKRGKFKWRHCGRRGGRGWRGRHHRGSGHHGKHRHNHRHRGGWRGRGRGRFHNSHPQNYGYEPSAPPMYFDDEIEAEAFEYTEELVSIMNMGFTNMGKIKKLLAQHKGDKQLVVQELVSAK